MKKTNVFLAFSICVFAAFLPGCASNQEAPQPSVQQQIYDESAARIHQKYKSGQITQLQSVQQMLFLAKQQFPNDALLHRSWERVVELSEQLAAGQLTKDQFNTMLDDVWMSFESANKARHAQAQAEYEQQRSRAATATLLNGIGNAFRRTYPGGTTCNTWGNNTTCSNY